MFSSLRIRLTLWYAGALAVSLAVFVLVFYFALEQTVRIIADDSIDDAGNSLISTLRTENRLNRELILTDDTIKDTLEDFRFQYIVFVVFDDEITPVAASPILVQDQEKRITPFNLEFEDIPLDKVREAVNEGEGFATFATRNEPEVRMFVKRAEFETRTLVIAAVRPLTAQLQLLRDVRLLILAGIPFVLLISSAGGYYLARKSLSPVREMVEKAASISSRNLSERVPRGPVDDELAQIADAFNGLLTRLETSFQQQKRFMADASHELRTPLAIMRGEAEVSLLKEERSEDEYRESLDIIRQEGARLSRIVEDLFILARADSGRLKPGKTAFYVDEVAMECARAMRTLVEENSQELTLEVEEGLVFTGDENLIRRLMLNLLDNAVKYSGKGGRIEFSCVSSGDNYEISVENSGNPIPDAEKALIFERFFRSDKVRTHNEDHAHGTGAGLGLAIGRSIASIHGGSLYLEKSDEKSTRFSASLPMHLHVTT